MQIPKEVKQILHKLNDSGHEAYIVGGCVRDLIMGKAPQDWDVTTNARPEEIQKLFPDSFYENQFGTVGIKTGSDDQALAVVEATTYRIESKYSDKRHPDEIRFAGTLEEDLARRDFTINALAAGMEAKVVDLFGGQEDISKKLVRAVGDPENRFEEDALRMLRAVRLAAQLGFEIEAVTLAAINRKSGLLKVIAKERIREELVKIIESPEADIGLEHLRQTGLLEYILPELLEGVGVGQNKHHIYDVWEHNLRALKYSVEKNYSLEVRLASLLHDVGKPRSKRGEGPESTFYAHEMIGARLTAKALARLRFPLEQADKITKLVRFHLFYYYPGEVTESSVRRLVANIGRENVEDLIKVREADRIGSGVPKAKPYKLRHLQFMIDKVARDPISPKMLKITGDDIMKLTGLPQSIRVGSILHALMDEVLDDPARNNREYLDERVAELNQLSDEELAELARRGREKSLEEEEKEIGQIKRKHNVE